MALRDTPSKGNGPRRGPGPIDPSTTVNIAPVPSLPLSLLPLPTTTTTTTTMASLTTDTSTDTGTDSNSLTTSPTATVTGTFSPSPTPAPWSFFSPSTLATTCQPYQIQWTTTDAISNSSLIHLNLFTTTPSGLNTTVVAGSRPIVDDAYTWPAVTLPPGTYVMHGVENDGPYRVPQSYMFTVRAGPNTTCVSAPGTGNSGTSSGTGSGTGTGAVGAPSQSGTPINAASTGKSSNTGAIAGGTVGGIILLACAGLAAYFCCMRRRRPGFIPSSRMRSTPPSGAGNKEWNGLSSVDSKLPIAGSLNAVHGHEDHRQGYEQEQGLGHDLGHDLGHGQAIGVPLVHAPGQGMEDYATRRESAIRAIAQARLDSTSTLGGEKVVMHDSARRGSAAVAAAGPIGATTTPTNGTYLSPTTGFTRQGSWSSTNVFETDGSSTSVGGVSPRPELAYLSTTNAASATAIATSANRRPTSTPRTSPRSSLDLDPFATPTVSSPNGSNSNHVNNSAPNSRRTSRTPRKPVPAYDPTPDELEAMGGGVRTGQLQHQLQQRLQHEHWEQRVGSESPSSTMLSHSYSPTTTESYLQHQHQQGVDGYDGHGYGRSQAVHYLIPDMPVVPPN